MYYYYCYWAKWENVMNMIGRVRHLQVAGWGTSDEYGGILEMTTIVAQENLDKVKQALTVRALGGEPALLAPH
jgi:hypothetical protein